MAGTYTHVELAVEVDGEREDLLLLLNDQRAMFEIALRNLTDEQARQRTTVSELTLASLTHHLTAVQNDMAAMIEHPDPDAEMDPSALAAAWAVDDDVTLAELVERLHASSQRFDEAYAAADPDTAIPQPTAPWAPERISWPVRRLGMHLLRELAQHTGHADILRESLDGQTAMAALTEGMDWSPGSDT